MNPTEQARERHLENMRKRNRERYHSDSEFRQAAIDRATEHKRKNKPSAMQNWKWYSNRVLKKVGINK